MDDGLPKAGQQQAVVNRLSIASAADLLPSHSHLGVPSATVGAGGPVLLAYGILNTRSGDAQLPVPSFKGHLTGFMCITACWTVAQMHARQPCPVLQTIHSLRANDCSHAHMYSKQVLQSTS
jgi:hypothetical protein